MAAPITTEQGWRLLAVQQLVDEGAFRREGDRLRPVPPHTDASVSPEIDRRVRLLRAHDQGHSARQEALTYRHAEERTAIKSQAGAALAALKAQIAAAKDQLASRQRREQYDLISNRYRLTPED